MSTYLELQNEVLSHQLNDTKYRPYVKQWLNEAARYVALQIDFRSLQDTEAITTTSGDSTYSLPSDFARKVDLTYNQDLLTELELRDFDDLSTSSGTPYAYIIIGSEVNLYPTPDAAYSLSLRYRRLPAEMVNDSDESEIPEQYHHLLPRYTLIRCYQRENDYEAATYFRAEFDNDLAKARGEAQYEGQDGPRQVAGTWDDGLVDLRVWR